MSKSSLPSLLGIDVGGTKIEVCLFTEDYDLVSSASFPTSDFSVGSKNFLVDIRGIIKRHLEETVRRIGVALRGVIEDDALVHGTIFGGQMNYPIVKRFTEYFGVPVTVENDVNAVARAEVAFGQGKGVAHFAFVNMGTGIRVSCITKGELLTGFRGTAGEISPRKMRMPDVDYKERQIRDVIPGRGIEKLYEKYTGRVRSAEEIFKSASSRSERRVIKIFARELGNVLSDVSYFYNPEVIVLGGSVMKSAKHFLKEAKTQYQRQTHELMRCRKILTSRLHHGGCLGAILSDT